MTRNNINEELNVMETPGSNKQNDPENFNKDEKSSGGGGEKNNEIKFYLPSRDCESPVERVKFEGLSDDSSSMYSEESDDEELPPIPDGGWGWVVVASAFLISACADGMAFTYGLIREEITVYFNTTNSKTSLVGGLFISTPLIAGPIMSALVDRFGCRVMTIIAGVASTIGFILASISNSVEMLCVTYGLISGLAMGILYVTAVVPVAFWFDKKRNFAVSLASCGIGFGTLVYSPLTYYLLEIYDWRNTLIILAGTLLNMCVCGAVMRDPDWLIIKQRRKRKLSKYKRSNSASSVSSKSVGGESTFLTQEELKDLMKSGKSPEYILHTLATTIAEAEQLEATTQINAGQTLKRKLHSDINLPNFVKQNEKVPAEVIEKLLNNKRLYNMIIRNYPHLITRRRSEANMNADLPSQDAVNDPAPITLKVRKSIPNADETYNKVQNIDEMNTVNVLQHVNESKNQVKKEKSKSPDKNTTVNKPKLNTANTNTHNLRRRMSTFKNFQDFNWLTKIYTEKNMKNMPLYRNTVMHRGAMVNISKFRSRSKSMPDIYKNSEWSLGSESDDEWKWYHRFWHIICKTFDFRMFIELHFLMFNISSIILSAWFIVPYYFLTSYMSALNVDGGPVMISIIGIASSIGIVALGWAGDQPWINVPKAFTLCIIVCGLSVASYPLFIKNFWAVAVISAIFGLTFASSYSYTPAMLMVLMPVDHFTVAYGLILFSEGIGHLFGPPLAGYIYDVTGMWELTFYIGGFSLVISGLCIAIIAYTKNRKICGGGPLLKDLEDKSRTADV